MHDTEDPSETHSHNCRNVQPNRKKRHYTESHMSSAERPTLANAWRVLVSKAKLPLVQDKDDSSIWWCELDNVPSATGRVSAKFVVHDATTRRADQPVVSVYVYEEGICPYYHKHISAENGRWFLLDDQWSPLYRNPNTLYQTLLCDLSSQTDSL